MRSLRMARDNKTDSLHGIIEKSEPQQGRRSPPCFTTRWGAIRIRSEVPRQAVHNHLQPGHSHAQHLIFIHSTKAIGGGKSDEKLSRGTSPSSAQHSRKSSSGGCHH